MIVVLGPRMLEQPWLLVSLATYAVAAIVAFAVQRPQLRRLQARDDIRDRRRPRGLAGSRPAPALRRVRAHVGRRPHRVPDVDEAAAVVTPRSAAIVNLGCKVNQSEMEGAARLLREAGVPLVDPDRGADLVLVNTCTVTAIADEKSRAAVRRARRANPDAEIVITGCSVQVGPEAFATVDDRARLVGNDGEGRVPGRARGAAGAAATGRPSGPLPTLSGVDLVAAPIDGIADDRAVRRADAGLRQGPGRLLVLLHLLHHPAGPRRRAIARARGRARRRPPRARRRPPRDRAHRDQHRHLRRRLVGARAPRRRTPARRSRSPASSAGSWPRPTIERIRLSSIEPQHVDDELLAAWVDGAPRTLPHLHLPLQSGDDGVLRRMGRRYSTADYARVVERVRGGDPRRRRPRRRHRRLPDRGRCGVRADRRVHPRRWTSPASTSSATPHDPAPRRHGWRARSTSGRRRRARASCWRWPRRRGRHSRGGASGR